MPKIRILPDRVANQIAAGEVIERPAAVVKELVENALDAGATRIEVEFRQGGRALIRVEDNGAGMSRDDALLCLERHATSKLVEADDLNRLGTYGFRGEAIPSIASISRFTLQTREAGAEFGTEVLVNGGKLVHVRECGRPQGTRIEVAQLFHPVPARRKFLKSDQTEAAHMIQCVRLYALACPDVSFALIEDGRVVFRSPRCEGLADRVAEIFGRQIAADLVPLDATGEGFTLWGLVGRPGVGRATRHELVTFVNGRPVDSRTLNYALIESYHDSIPRGRYPLAFLFLQLDPAAVDVNVHPAKREIRFRSEAQVRGFVIRIVLQRLRELGQSAAGSVVPTTAATSSQPVFQTVPCASSARSGDVAPAHAHRPTSGPAMAPVTPPAPRMAPSPASPPAQPVSVAPVSLSKPQFDGWKFIGLAHGSLAVFETRAGVVLLDRRAATERVAFERLRAQYVHGVLPPTQRLLLPVPVELDPVASAMLLDRLEFIQAHGFEIVEFGRNFFRIEAVPDWMEPADAETFLRDLLGALRDGRFPGRDARLDHEEFARLAASRALRLPVSASEREMKDLLERLFATASPLTSPAGRPTFIELSHGELNRRFQK